MATVDTTKPSTSNSNLNTLQNPATLDEVIAKVFPAIKVIPYEGPLRGCSRCGRPASYIVKKVSELPEAEWNKKHACGACTELCVNSNTYMN
jgi:hypothetical protein